MCGLKLSSSHEKKEKETGGINFKNTFYLTQQTQNRIDHLISSKPQFPHKERQVRFYRQGS